KTQDLDFIRIGLNDFQQCPADSIDYAIMEHTTQGIVIGLDVGWNDLGSWSSLWKYNQKDEQQNVIFGDVLTEQSQSNYIYASSRLVTVLGVENLIVVETKDAVLVAHQDKSQEIKSIVAQLKQQERIELLQHKEVVRP